MTRKIIPQVGESWIQAYERSMGHLRVTGEQALPQELLKSSPTNRIIPVNLSRLLILWRILGARYEWKWCGEIANLLEDYQLTAGEPVNSRTQFLNAIAMQAPVIQQAPKESQI